MRSEIKFLLRHKVIMSNLLSSALINFITNGKPCYVKIRNIATGLYLRINIPINSFTEIERPVHVEQCGSIIIMSPTYAYSLVTFSVPTNLNYPDSTQEERIRNIFVMSSPDSILLKKSEIQNNDTKFYLSGTLEELYICSSHQTKNMFNEDGRYLYATDECVVHVDGDRSIHTSVWRIEKLNEKSPLIDVRQDYKSIYDDINRASERNLTSLFPNFIKYFSIYNIKYKKYLGVAIGEEKSYLNRLTGTNDNTKFVLRKNPDENYIYISYCLNDRCMNILTFPKVISTEAFIGAPDSLWSKFYVIKKNNDYLFQCFHRDTDDYGNIGRFLRMTEDNKIDTLGNDNDDASKWKISEIKY